MTDSSDSRVGDCPPLQRLQQCFDRELSEAEGAAVHAHIDACDACREFMAAMARFEEGAAPPPPPIQQGDEVGRYTVGPQLGVGAMGVVYEAYDRELHRPVALKFLSRSVVSGHSEQARLFDEARAMAQVSHHNVAQVYEAAEIAGRVFIAMELVSGQTLEQWLDGQNWRTLLEVFAQSAWGLEAAHAKGVVHGDFKPHNVLVSESGAPKIIDFGLAGVAARRPHESPRRDEDGASQSLSGTPLYLSPERWRNELADAHSDQFAFCVALFGGLFDRQPFPGGTLRELEANVTAGNIDVPHRVSGVPTRVQRAVLRGLRVAPSQRWPSMAALAIELQECRVAHARRRLWIAGAAIAAVSGTVGGLGTVDTNTCPSPTEFAAQLWSAPQRREVEEKLQPATGRAGEVALSGLDDYVERWATSRAEACERLRNDGGEFTAARVDQGLECLADARRAIKAAAAVLAATPAEDLTDPVGALEPLPDLDWCAGVQDIGTERLGEDHHQHGAVQAAREALATARALRGIGQLEEANLSVQAAEATLSDVDGDHPVWSEFRIVRGQVQFEAQRYDAANDDLLHALRASIRTGRDGSASQAARALALLLSSTDGKRTNEARAYARLAKDLASKRGDVAGTLAADSRLTAIELSAGSYGKALQHADAALALQQSRNLSDPLLRAALRMDRAEALGYLGRLQEAEKIYRLALATTGDILGEEHRRTAVARTGLAAALGAQGDFDAALVELRAARRTFEATFGPGDRHTVDTTQNIAVGLLGQRQFASAEREFRSLLALPSLPGSAANLLRVHCNLGAALVGQGLFTEATNNIEAALGVADLEDDHAVVMACHEVVGGALAAAGEFAQAAKLYADLVEQWQQRGSPRHPSLLRIRLEFEFLRWRTGTATAAQVAAEVERIKEAAHDELDPAHAVLLRAELTLAKLAVAQQQLDRADSLYRAAFEAASPGSGLHGETLVAFGRYLFHSARHAEVVDVLTPARLAAMDGGTRAEGLSLRGYALWELAEDRPAARALVQEAVEHYELRPGSFPARATRTRAWLLEHTP
ncbi:MAG: protein kinase domain-containing protein [Nannocystales bacterium]